MHVIAWEDEPVGGHTLDGLIAAHLGERPPPPTQTPGVVLLTSGTTGTPKGARRGAGGGVDDLVGLDRAGAVAGGGDDGGGRANVRAWGFGCPVSARRWPAPS